MGSNTHCFYKVFMILQIIKKTEQSTKEIMNKSSVGNFKE
jgi:hypothetical protein